MSGVLKVVATVAGIVAMIPSPIQPIAAAVATVATIGASITQKKPKAFQGNTSQIQIGSNLPMPYSMGRTYVGGAMIHDVGYGGTVGDIPNPYSTSVFVWSGGGPIDSVENFYADMAVVPFSGAAATGYYGGFMWLSTQLGATPEAAALAGPHGAIPDWSSAHKLSGYAAGLVTLKVDKKGKVYASGVPQFGAVIKAVLAYDPRKDSTYPGGSGAHRWDDESTWEWTENPGLHALTYARGRFHNGKKVFGCGFRKEGINIASFVEVANLCDANNWRVGGTIYEPGSRWDNLKRILEVAAAEPVWVAGRLHVKFNAPKVALDTITADDLAPGELSVPAMKTWKARKNGLVPKYRSEGHKWEHVQSDLVTDGTYVAEDGEDKAEEYHLELCQDKDQAAQVTAYRLVNQREFGPVILRCKPRLLGYVIGEALNVDIPELGLNDQLCVITSRRPEPLTGIVELGLESETTAKHSYALGQIGTAPPTPTLTSGEEVDAVIDRGIRSRGPYDADEIYYQGNIVQDQGSSWEYINVAPSSGHDPPTLPDIEDDYWRIFVVGGGTVHIEWSPDGVDSWGDYEAGDRYLRYSTDGGSTWTDPVLAVGEDGAPGDDGLVKQHVFKRATSAPATPTGNGLPSGWSDGPPAGTDPLYMSVALQELDGTLIGSWSTPVRLDGAAGAPGSTSTLVYIFQRSASAPTLPSATTTYTFATGALTGLNNGWTQTIPAGTNPLYVSVASAIGTSTTDTIAAGEWASAVILAQNGTDGLNAATVFLYQRTATNSAPSAPGSSLTYTFATGVLSGSLGSWTQSVPSAAGGAYLWVTTATAVATTATDSIASGEWATVNLLAHDGAAGAPGLQNAIVYLYQRAASAPSVPGSTLTYTFATGALSGTLGSWSQSVPAGTNPLYVTTATASATTATDTIATGEWASPVVMAQDGTAGLNAATVFLYHRTATNSAPSLPSTTLTYTFATGVLSGTLGSWAQSVPAAAGGAYLWITTATALGTGATDTIASGEWATANLLAQDGSTGAPGSNNALVLLFQRSASAPSVPGSTLTYTFATGVLSGTLGSWTQAVPAGTSPLYATSAVASASTATDTIATGEWATPVVLAQDGAAGLNAATVFLYQRNATGTPPSVPGSTLTYTFATGVLTGTLGSWTQTVPADSGGPYLFVTTASAIGTSTTDTIATGEWATVRLLAQDGTDAPNLLVQWSVNGSTSWHSTFAAGDLYLRTSSDGGSTWSAAALVVGEDGAPGDDGLLRRIVFKRASSAPSTPSGNGVPSGWSDSPPAETAGAFPFGKALAADNSTITLTALGGGEYDCEQTSGTDGSADYAASATGSHQFTGDFVVRIKPDFTSGEGAWAGVATSGNVLFGWAFFSSISQMIQNGSSTGTTATYSLGAYFFVKRVGTTITYWKGTDPDIANATLFATYGSGVGTALSPKVQLDTIGAKLDYLAYDPADTPIPLPLYMSTSTQELDGTLVGSWSAPVRLDSDDGLTPDLKFKRSVSPPARPTGDSPAGWGDGIPSGTEPLWASRATRNTYGNVVGVWSTPQLLAGQIAPTNYNAGTTYYRYQTVLFGGGQYMLVVESSTGNAPSGDAQANTWWEVISAPGEAGTPATPPSGFTSTIPITSTTGLVNLRTLADTNGYPGGDATVTFTIANGVLVQGSAGGGKAIDTGVWPSGYTVSLTLQIDSGGEVRGGGGYGGTGGDNSVGSSGGSGGDAINCQHDLIITNSGAIRGGGGGGGGGTGVYSGFPEPVGRGGGGGGGGSGNGLGGAGGTGDVGNGAAGGNASGSTAGSGGAGSGGGSTAGAAGGTYGVAGSNVSGGASGGAAGYAVRKNGKTVSASNGTVSGSWA